MKTRFPTGTADEREQAVAAASLTIQRGELVIIPTDTVYGLAADAFDSDAVQDLLELKGRGREMPPPVLVSSATTLDALAVRVPEYARALVKEFWPGPLTVVCHQQSSLQWDLGDTRATVAIRMPDHPIALEILERTGPLAVSSANLTGKPAATDADQVSDMFIEDVAVIVDAGTSPGGEASTIVDCTGPTPRVLREGALSQAQLDTVLRPLGLALSGEPPEPVEPAVVVDQATAEEAPAKKTPAKRTAAKKTPAKKTTAKKTTAKKSTVKKTPATKTPATSTAATKAPAKAPAKKAPARKAPAKTTVAEKAPVTDTPTTEAPTTEAPTTEAPTTEAPTTEAPTATTAASETSAE